MDYFTEGDQLRLAIAFTVQLFDHNDDDDDDDNDDRLQC